MARQSELMASLAREGAEQRLRALHAEIRDIYRAFPELAKRGTVAHPGQVATGRTRRKMSAKGRAAISRAQKARWAKQKAAAKKS